MTPTELQALLDREGVPMEARAPLRIADSGAWWETECPGSRGTYIDDDLAELAHVGAMVKWLLIRDTGIEFYYPSLGEGYTVIVASRGNRRHVASTLTESLAHACGRIAKEKADPMNCPKCTTRTVISGNAKVCLNCGWKEKDNA